MKSYAEEVKKSLETVIENLEKNYQNYVKNPKKDFSRNRKLNFNEMIRIIGSVAKNISNQYNAKNIY